MQAIVLKARDARNNMSLILRCRRRYFRRWPLFDQVHLLGCPIFMSVTARSRARLWRQICPWPLDRRLLRQALDHRVGDQSVAAHVVMVVSKDEELLVPAAGLAPRALGFHGKESWKHRDELLALAFAPIAPDMYLPGLRAVVNELCRIGIDHDADGDVSLLQLLPEKVHLRLLLGDAALHPQRRITGREWVCFINFAVGPRGGLHVKIIAKIVCGEVIVALPDKKPLG